MNIQVKPNTTLNNKTSGWSDLKPKFLPDKCTACGICPRVCPEGIVYQTDKTNLSGKKYYEFDPDYCKGCGLCAVECPFKAIVMEKEEK